MRAREAILRKRCGVGHSFDLAAGFKESEDPYDEYYTVVKANDCTKNISEPLFSAGLIDDNFEEKIKEVMKS